MSVHSATGATYDGKGRLLKHTHDALANRRVDFPNNPSTLYIVGDEDTEGGLRLHFASEGVVHIQKRIDSVWNSGSLEVGTNSIRMGDNVSLSAAGDSLEVSSLVRDRRSLMTHVNIDDSGALIPHTVQAGPLVEHNIFQADDSTDNVLAQHFLPVVPGGEGFLYTIFVKVGAVAPVDDVKLIFSDGLAPGGTLLLSLNYPPSFFPANTEIELILEGGISFLTNVSGLVTIESPVAFSLLGTASEIMWLAANFQSTTDEDIVIESLVYNNDLGHVLDTNLDPVYEAPIFAFG